MKKSRYAKIGYPSRDDVIDCLAGYEARYDLPTGDPLMLRVSWKTEVICAPKPIT